MARKKRRNSSIVDGLNAFAATYKMTRGVMQDRDMSEAAGAKQTEDKGFTVEQGEQLDAVANAKDENGKAFYNVNATDDGKYQVTPNKEVFDARGASADLTNSTANIDPIQKYTFQGKTRDTAFTEAEQDTGRMNAMAGVFSKYGDPVKALDMRQKAGQIEAQGLQKRIAEQGLALGETQISAAKRAEVAGVRQESASNAIMEAGQAQAAAAAQSPDQSRFLQGIAGAVGVGGKPGEGGVADIVRANPANAGAAKMAGSMGVEAMIRANAGPNATESELQQAMTAYRQSIGDAQANQNASSMGELYKRQGEIWNNVGGDPVKAAAAYKMAEAEGLPQVIEKLKAKDVDGANKIWNSSGQGKGIITEVRSNPQGELMAIVVDPFTGKSMTVPVSQMERQMMSLKDQAGLDANKASTGASLQSIEASKANVIQGQEATKETRRSNLAREGISRNAATRADREAAMPALARTAEWMVANKVAPDLKAAVSLLNTSKGESVAEKTADLTGKIIAGQYGTTPENAHKQAKAIMDLAYGQPAPGVAAPKTTTVAKLNALVKAGKGSYSELYSKAKNEGYTIYK